MPRNCLIPPSIPTLGRFFRLTLTVLLLAESHHAFPAGQGDFPPLPKPPLQQFQPAVRAQVRDAYAAVVASPRNAAANGKLGMILHAYSQLEGAEVAYGRAYRLSPSVFNWIYYLAVVQAAQGKCSDAIQSLQQALHLHPDYLPAMLKLAECLRASSRWKESENAYRQILERHPENAEAYFGLGKAQAGENDLNAAAQSYRTACAFYAEYGPAHYALALAYRALNQDQEARVEFQAYEKNKDSVPLNSDPLMQQVRALNRSAAEQIRLGYELEHAGRLQEAAEAHESALLLDPEMVQADVNLISIYGRLKQPEKAERHFRHAIQLAPNEEGAYYNYGVLMKGEGRPEEAEKAFRNAVEISPAHAEAHYNLGVLLEQRGMLAEAEREFQSAVEHQPGFRAAHFHLGRVLINHGDFSGGIQHLLKTIGTDDDDTPTYLYALGAAYARAGDRQTAVRYLRQGRSQAQSRKQDRLVASIEKDLKTLEALDNSQ